MDQLTTCNDCSSRISVRATTCPSCGAPVWRDRAALSAQVAGNRVRSTAQDLWSSWQVRALFFSIVVFGCLSQLGMKSRGLRDQDRFEPGNELVDPIKYAIRHYTVIGRAIRTDMDDSSFAVDPKFENNWYGSLDEESRLQFFRKTAALSSPSVDELAFYRAKSADHLEHILNKAAALRFDHIGFVRRKSASFFVHVATAAESIAAGLLLALLPLHRSRRSRGAETVVEKVPSETDQRPIC